MHQKCLKTLSEWTHFYTWSLTVLFILIWIFFSTVTSNYLKNVKTRRWIWGSRLSFKDVMFYLINWASELQAIIPWSYFLKLGHTILHQGPKLPFSILVKILGDCRCIAFPLEMSKQATENSLKCRSSKNNYKNWIYLECWSYLFWETKMDMLNKSVQISFYIHKKHHK